MPTYRPRALLPNDEPGPWSELRPISYAQRDVLLYAVGIGCTDLRHVYEQHPQFAVFPTFAIRWGSMGLALDADALPPSPGPLTIDAERQLELLAPLPLEGTVLVRSRLISVHPRPRGGGFVEVESEVIDGSGEVCVRMLYGSFRRGIHTLGDIETFDGAGMARSGKNTVPERTPDVDVSVHIGANQAQIYRLSGDYNPLHIEPEAAIFGGFPRPILHGLCTFGHCAHLLLDALCDADAARFGGLKLRFSAPVYPGDTLRLVGWHDGPGRLMFEARVGDKTVVSNASFSYR